YIYPQSYYSFYSPPLESIGYDPAYVPGPAYGLPQTSYRDYLAQPAGPTEPPPADNAAHVEVRVPEGAEVWFGNTKTQQTGSAREFVPPALTPGQDYTYEIRARWRDGDREVVLTRRLDVRAGSWKGVDFTRPSAEEVPEPPKPNRK